MPANSDSPQCVLTAPVVDSTYGQFAITEVTGQGDPTAQAVLDRLFRCGAWRYFRQAPREPVVQAFAHRHGFGLPQRLACSRINSLILRFGGRVLFMQKVAVSLLCCSIDRFLGVLIEGVPSGPLAEGDACVHCCGHI